MFPQLNSPQLAGIPTNTSTNGAVKLFNAVQTMKAAFADIMDPSNYTSADINDPYVSFALSLYSKYNNDIDFHNTLQFPIQPSTHFNHMNQLQQQLPQSIDHLKVDKYLYPADMVYGFQSFPSIPMLPSNVFNPELLKNLVLFERLCMMGATLLKYSIETVLLQHDKVMSTDKVYDIVKSLINENSLSILASGVGLEYDYGFTNCGVPQHKLILAYFGQFYLQSLQSSVNQQGWKELNSWTCLILGYPVNELQISTGEVRHHLTTSSLSHSNVSEDKTHLSDELNTLLRNVCQDLNSHKSNSVDIVYDIEGVDVGENSNAVPTIFNCKLKLNDTILASYQTNSKKHARTHAALKAAVSESILPFLKRSSRDFWFRKYVDNATHIIGLIDTTTANDKSYNDLESEILSDTSKISDKVIKHFSELSLKDCEGRDISETDEEFKQAKAKLYSQVNQSMGFIPVYEYEQLNTGEFSVSLRLNKDRDVVATAIGRNKKVAGSIVAFKFLQLLDDYLESISCGK